MIGVVDTGGANLTSLFAACERLGRTATLVNDPVALQRSSHVLLPGVGAAGEAMRRLRASGLAERIADLQVPVLGICLGMQLLFEHSAEGNTDGLGVLSGRAEALVPGERTPVPHMGWSKLSWLRKSSIAEDIEPTAYFYFVHSFAVAKTDATVALATHGDEFSAITENKNFFGTQFHPERSGRAGSKLLQNFLAL